MKQMPIKREDKECEHLRKIALSMAEKKKIVFFKKEA